MLAINVCIFEQGSSRVKEFAWVGKMNRDDSKQRPAMRDHDNTTRLRRSSYLRITGCQNSGWCES